MEKAIRYLGVAVDYPCPTANGTMTALIIASSYGHKEVLRVLLSHGADVNAADEKPKASQGGDRGTMRGSSAWASKEPFWLPV